jgi:hypothetical protein
MREYIELGDQLAIFSSLSNEIWDQIDNQSYQIIVKQISDMNDPFRISLIVAAESVLENG